MIREEQRRSANISPDSISSLELGDDDVDGEVDEEEEDSWLFSAWDEDDDALSSS